MAQREETRSDAPLSARRPDRPRRQEQGPRCTQQRSGPCAAQGARARNLWLLAQRKEKLDLRGGGGHPGAKAKPQTAPEGAAQGPGRSRRPRLAAA
eukprot:14702365-Alexandrium_andersonii.AAC.1